MTKRLMLPLLIAGLGLGVALPAAAGELPAAEDLFAKQAEAIGGEKLATVESVTLEFTFDMAAMGLSTTGETFVQVPDKSYSVISLAAMGSADFEAGINGEVVWQNNPQMGPRLLDGNERRMALRGLSLDPFAGWKTLWEKAETVSEETVDGRACYKVVLSPADGAPVSAWIDKETSLLVREEMPIPQMGASLVTRLSDYREVDGLKVAHRIELEGPMSYVIEYTDVRLNDEDVPEDDFEVPEGIQALAGQ